MTDLTGIDWEDAFSNASYIPGGLEIVPTWQAQAAAFRARAHAEFDIAYGDSNRHRLDLFLPEGAPKGLVIFVHGGFWLNFDKSYWSHLAEGPLVRGWAVAVPSYTLAPEARISQMTQEVARAVEHAAAKVAGPICLAGHSAGGHLVTRMICDPSPLAGAVAGRIARVVSISGVHDLRPLQLHSMNQKLGIDPAEAEVESPALLSPLTSPDITAWVGAKERPEFLRQSQLLVEAWAGQGASPELVVEPGRHHFDVIEGLMAPDHLLTLRLCGS